MAGKSKQIQNLHQSNSNTNRPKNGKTDNRPFNKLRNISQNKHGNSGKPSNKFNDGNKKAKSFDSKDGKKPFKKFNKVKDQTHNKLKNDKDNNPKDFKNNKIEKQSSADLTVNYVLNPIKLEQRLKEVNQQKHKEMISEKKSAYQQKKSLRNDIYTQTTKKNQPVMAGRMKLLFGQLQKSLGVQE